MISINGDNPAVVLVGKHYAEQGATALDDKDGIVAVVSSRSVDTAKVGRYPITYTAKDRAGNEAKVQRMVQVIEASPLAFIDRTYFRYTKINDVSNSRYAPPIPSYYWSSALYAGPNESTDPYFSPHLAYTVSFYAALVSADHINTVNFVLLVRGAQP